MGGVLTAAAASARLADAGAPRCGKQLNPEGSTDMPERKILAVDDIGNRTDAGRARSLAIGRIASSLARRLGAGIDLLYVEDLRSFPAGRFDASRFRAWHAGQEKRLAEAAGRFGVPAACSLGSGSPVEEILRAVRTRPAPELVVMGTRGRRGVERLFLGSVAEEVVRRSRRPVLVIGPAVPERACELSVRRQLRLLVPTDLGRNSRSAERYALSLARRTGAKVTLFHCLWDGINAVIVNAAYAGMAAYDLEAVIERSREDAAAALRRKAEFFQKHGVPCSWRVEEQAQTSMCAVHRESGSGHDLVVMGTHGRNAVLAAFLGSTARETIMHAAVPVIIVHS
jgi:nucleotide-binding universal stress UspA family protein